MKSLVKAVPCSVLSGGATVYSLVWRCAEPEIELCDPEGGKGSQFPLKVVEISQKYPLTISLERAKKCHEKSFSQSPDH